MKYIIEEYKKEWLFFKKEMKVIFLIMLVGLILLMVGSHFLLSALIKSQPGLINSIAATIQEALSGVDLANDSPFTSVIKLFFNNARVCLISISLGIVPFLFLPIFTYFINGAIVGAVTAFSSAVANFGLSFFIASLLPHGIFEFPAIVYACALGIYLCKENTKIVLKKSDKRFINVAIDTLRSYVIVILPLLVFAAIIEGTITINIAMKFI